MVSLSLLGWRVHEPELAPADTQRWVRLGNCGFRNDHNRRFNSVCPGDIMAVAMRKRFESVGLSRIIGCSYPQGWSACPVMVIFGARQQESIQSSNGVYGWFMHAPEMKRCCATSNRILAHEEERLKVFDDGCSAAT